MANEITVTSSLELSNGYLSKSWKVSAFKISQNAALADDFVQSIPTSDTALTLSVTTLGYCMVRNLDTTNFVKIGPDSGGAIIPLIKLEAGEVALMRLMTGITMRAIADTAAVKIRVMLFND